MRVGGNQENIPFILFPALGVITKSSVLSDFLYLRGGFSLYFEDSLDIPLSELLFPNEESLYLNLEISLSQTLLLKKPPWSPPPHLHTSISLIQ